MKNWWLVAGLSLALLSCGKGLDKNSREYDIRQIYKALVERSATYNRVKIRVSESLLRKPIDDGSMRLIRKGLRNYNAEIQASIDEYNLPAEDRPFLDGLASVGARGGAGATFQLSKVGFNKAREYAVVFESDTATAEIRHASFLFFRKVDGEWRIETEIIVE